MNTQPTEKRTTSTKLDFHSMFMTIQGEGPFSGRPAIFIRLAGCNLQCPLCDTEYTNGRQLRNPETVAYEAAGMAERWEKPLFVITGGEPFRQPLALAELVNELLEYGEVQIETNGSLWHPALDISDPDFHIVVSPKTSRVKEEIAVRAAAWKYVAQAGDLDKDGLPKTALGHPTASRLSRPVEPAPVYLQPADEGNSFANAANAQAVLESCLANGYIYCHQLHKTIGVP